MANTSFRSYVYADNRLWCDVSLTITEQSYSVANNSSVVAYSFSGHQRNDGFGFTGTARDPAGNVIVQINGSDVKMAGIALKSGIGTCSGSGTFTVPHNSDGTKTVSFSIRMNEVNGNYTGDKWRYKGVTASSTLKLTTIPRQSSISVSGSNLGSAVSVSISRNSSSFTHKVWYSFNGSEWYAVTSSAATSATFTPPLSLGSRIPNSTSGTLTVYVDTMNGSTKIGNTISKSITLSMPSSVVPAMGNPTATRVDNGVPSSWGIYVKNKSKVTIKINSPAGAYGSTIKSYSITGPNLNSGSSSATSGVLSSSGTLTYTCRVTDSRGRSVSKTVSIAVVDYHNPSITVSADRCNSTGVITGDGTYLRVVVNYGYASVSGKNSISSKSVTCNSVSNTTFGDNAAFTLAANCSIGSKYTLTATVRDALGNSASASIEIPTAARIINVRQNKKGIAFGKFSEKDAFEVAMPAYFEKGLSVNKQTPAVGELVSDKLTTNYVYQNGFLFSKQQTSSTVNKWTKVASLVVRLQFGDSNLSFEAVWNGHDHGYPYRATVYARVKQQNPLGQTPDMRIIVDGVNITSDNFALVVTENTTSLTTVQVWSKNPITWAYICYYYNNSLGEVILNNDGTFQDGLPSGYTKYGENK